MFNILETREKLLKSISGYIDVAWLRNVWLPVAGIDNHYKIGITQGSA